MTNSICDDNTNSSFKLKRFNKVFPPQKCKLNWRSSKVIKVMCTGVVKNILLLELDRYLSLKYTNNDKIVDKYL